MSAEPIAPDPADRVRVRPHERSEPDDPLYRFLDELGQQLTDEGTELLYNDVGQALMRSIQTGDDVHVNRTIEAWHRTLALKAAGADDIARDQVDPLEAGEEPVTMSELRARLA